MLLPVLYTDMTGLLQNVLEILDVCGNFSKGEGVTKVVTTLPVGRFALCKIITY